MNDIGKNLTDIQIKLARHQPGINLLKKVPIDPNLVGIKHEFFDNSLEQTFQWEF